MVRLFRNPNDSQNWFAFSIRTGWVRFPASVGGWEKRCPVAPPQPAFEISVLRAFKTGMLEAVNDWRAHAA